MTTRTGPRFASRIGFSITVRSPTTTTANRPVGTYSFDARTMSVLRVRNFEQILAALDLDVLALFGEKDTNVDWRRARELYEATVGRNPSATLTVRTFPDCNHSLNVSATGSVREVEGTPLDAGPKCPGYYDVQIEWLRQQIGG